MLSLVTVVPWMVWYLNNTMWADRLIYLSVWVHSCGHIHTVHSSNISFINSYSYTLISFAYLFHSFILHLFISPFLFFHTHTHPHPPPHTHTLTHTLTHTHTHTLTHTHTHTRVVFNVLWTFIQCPSVLPGFELSGDRSHEKQLSKVFHLR